MQSGERLGADRLGLFGSQDSRAKRIAAMWKARTSQPLVGHSPTAVARFMLSRARERDFAVTPMKLIKMVFLAHGWMLALHKTPLVRKPVEAWDYGPVFPGLYHALKHLGSQPVSLSDLLDVEEQFSPAAKKVMVDAVARYGPPSAERLSALTHAPSSPWELTYGRGVQDRPIPNELIQFYYRKMLELHGQNHPAPNQS